ncbi:hypothetical protein [Stenotrophomonas acidaminiphila]|uniref:hypothetical protein n=1 Tax=Stenotrophomonas acidaminiphila TaxID=128780 RepID=UPI0028ADF0D2|nr:hypothetical protein [Stenotrophomonas acidaminiphila]
MKRFVSLALLALVAACSRPEPVASGDQANADAEGKQSLVAEVSSGIAPILSSACNIEAVDGVVVQDMNPIVLKSRRFVVAGWLVDEAGADAPAALVIRVASQSGDGRVWQHGVVPTMERPDVQQAHGGAAGALKSGFSSEIDASGLDAGTYRLTLSYDRGGQKVVCDNGRAVIIK